MARILPRNILITKKYLSVPVYTSVRSHWNKDWKPGPYPKTPEERAAAAKKYGLLPHEYEPYPDDGLGHGDYPKMKPVSAEERDPYYPWDYPEHRRNWGEVLHVDTDIYGEDRLNTTRLRYSGRTQFMACFSIIMGFAALFIYFEDKPLIRPALPKQYPAEGVVHYTFERAE